MPPVDRLRKCRPPDPPKRGPRFRFLPVLDSIREKPHLHSGWVLLAEYESRTGARDAKSRFVRGISPVPGPITRWEFRAAQVDTGSQLYARYSP